MRVDDLKLSDNRWTNDTGQPVELYPPGIIVQPGQSLEVNPETRGVTVYPADYQQKPYRPTEHGRPEPVQAPLGSEPNVSGPNMEQPGQFGATAPDEPGEPDTKIEDDKAKKAKK